MNFNKSHINKTVRKNIIKAMLNVIKRGTVAHVKNRKGQAYLAVRHAGNGQFYVTDKAGHNVAHCFKAWPRLYSNMLAGI